MSRVAIIGVGQLPFKSRYPDQNFQELSFAVAKSAMADAKMGVKDIDSAVYSIYHENIMRQGTPDVMIHDYLGLNGKPGQRVTAGAATGAYAVKTAWAEVASGYSKVVLLVAVQKALDITDPVTEQRADAALNAENMTLDVTWHLPFSLQPWSLLLNAHMAKYGSPTPEQIAQVAVKNHRNGVRNPMAHIRIDMTVDEVLNSRLTNWPTTMFESCLYGETAAALVVVSEDMVQPHHKPIWITGVGTCHHNSTDRMGYEDAGRLWSVHGSAQRAYRMANIKDPRKELDLVELHDLVAGLEILSYGELGLCEVGQGAKLVDEGVTDFDGDVPVNPSGGRIACGHIAGVSCVHSTADVVLQLRGEAGERQVAIRTGKGLVSATGGSGLALGAAVVLER